MRYSLLQTYIFKFLIFSFTIVLLYLLNPENNDYQTLKKAYDNSWDGYGHGFQAVSSIGRLLDLNYKFVHFMLLALLFPFFINTNIAQIIGISISIILLFGVLNEQTRFYISLSGVSVAVLKRNYLLISLAMFHVAGAILGILVASLSLLWIYHSRFIWRFFLLVGTVFFGVGLKPIILQIGAAVGYGYAGTIFLEPSSVNSLFFKFLVFLSLIFYRKSEADHFYVLVLMSLICSIAFSDFAILSGRLLVFSSILYGGLIFSKSYDVAGYRTKDFKYLIFYLSMIMKVVILTILSSRF